jgi:hypothetical protein
MTILVLEDEPIVTAVVRQILKQYVLLGKRLTNPS